MRTAIATALLCVLACPRALALGQDQLYTGDAATVPPGQVQYQLYYNTTFNAGFRLSGTSFTFGGSGNSDVKLSYGYLWNDRGPNVQVGPTVGGKWRFAGDGRRRPSVATSVLYAINQGSRGTNRKNDIGGLLIVEYPTPAVTFLGNLGRIWVGDKIPDLRYAAFALVRRASRRVLVAAQYMDVTPLGAGTPGRQLSQYVGAIVYQASDRVGYSLQIGWAPRARNAHWNTTLGFSKFF